ncbi:uncharacterized protein BO97DRAFT_415078 [Aspergillus homomorphus CBS 101889]|uniref:DUF4246 domain-containing protein n=1 Tax=Aspergillus homomorphus (strain CBS 101889) TaxID=1450537 RepID=A0A395HVP9_ASPHC|nr:hypothetical protein BO97DRAFT_415078 [Aspergillus homomorphus CBS 101889]RAL11493.1 hypothetical protein BO97DRAFT_415078 [Aspergillus homomorphus CBS 101889]
MRIWCFFYLSRYHSQKTPKMDRSGDNPLQGPGFNDVPLYHELPRGARFAHGIADWRQTPQLTIWELGMLQFMSWVTEQSGWENKCEDLKNARGMYYSVSLQDQFPSLQVIIRISSIELNPEQPKYSGASTFNVAGILNEHIVATAMCYLDVDNIRDTSMSRSSTSWIGFLVLIRSRSIRQIYVPCKLWDPFLSHSRGCLSLGLTRCGLETNPSPSKIRRPQDPSRPGRLRFVTLWLVDPHYRICSTQNVPPQDSGWLDTGLNKSTEDRQRRGLMTGAEAIETAEQMRKERHSIAQKFQGRGHEWHSYEEDFMTFYYGDSSDQGSYTSCYSIHSMQEFGHIVSI